MAVITLAAGLVLFIGFFAAMMGSIEAGRRVARRAIVLDKGAQPGGLGAVETVAFGLLGLLLAFTFSGAASRLDARRTQIVDEANDIGTAWLRLDLLPAAAQPKLRDQLRQYTDSRIGIYRTFSQSGVDAGRAEYARSAALQNQIWSDAVAACRNDTAATIVLLPALNDMFDIAATRMAATQMHPPPIVFVVLAAISLLCGFLVGYEMGTGSVPSRTHMVVLAFVVTFTLYVIIDFEFPRLGFIRIDDFDQLLVQVRASMG